MIDPITTLRFYLWCHRRRRPPQPPRYERRAPRPAMAPCDLRGLYINGAPVSQSPAGVGAPDPTSAGPHQPGHQP